MDKKTKKEVRENDQKEHQKNAGTNEEIAATNERNRDSLLYRSRKINNEVVTRHKKCYGA
jgi:hypothetical protein